MSNYIMGLLNTIYKASKKFNKVNKLEDIDYIIPKESINVLKDSIESWQKKRLFMNIASPQVQNITKQKWFNVKGHFITTNWIKHIFKKHWENAKLQDNELPVTWEDIELIPKIIKKPDVLKISKNLSDSWNHVLKYEKVIWNKYYYLEYLKTKKMGGKLSVFPPQEKDIFSPPTSTDAHL